MLHFNGYIFNCFMVRGFLTSSSFDSSTVYLCKEMKCGLNCNEESHFVSLLEEKNIFHELTFIAVPNDGYKVKELIFNGKTITRNDSLLFTAKVTNELNYKRNSC